MATWIWPLPQYTRVGSPFGMRMHPIKHVMRMHSGQDISAPLGTKIYASRAGTVSFADWSNGYGKLIKINHGDGYETRYAHQSAFAVKAGQQVSAGQLIGYVGSTGLSTGPHLHFEVRRNGTALNPMNFVKPSRSLTGYTSSGGSGIDDYSASDVENDTTPQTKEITTVSNKLTVGKTAASKYKQLTTLDSVIDGYELLIENDKIYAPVVLNDIQLEQSRKNSPACLTFQVLKAPGLDIQEGNAVSFKVNGKKVFYGYIFSKKRNELNNITVKCYDQLRYLKSKDTLSYSDKTYGDLIKMLADSYQLVYGDIADTKHKMTRIEECSPLEMLSNAADETIMNAGQMYIFYDDFGKLTLKPLKDMLVPILITEATAEGYDYETTIDTGVYNRIKIAQDNSLTGERETYIVQDGDSQAKWGVLQHYVKLQSETASASTAGGGGTPADISGEANTAAAIFAFLSSAGYSDAGAAGIMGNMFAESGLNTKATNPSSGAYGLCQWLGGRKTALLNYARGKGKNSYDLQTQLEFFQKEMVEQYSGPTWSVNGTPLRTYLSQVTSVKDAEYWFLRKFERGSAAEIRQSEPKRLSKAQGYYNSFSGGKYKQYLSGNYGSTTRAASNDSTSSTTENKSVIDTTDIKNGDTATITALGKTLLKYYNRKQRRLTVTGCFGSTYVRGGSCVYVNLNLGDMQVDNIMLVEQVTHHFNDGIHTMDLKLSGIKGEFNV